MAAEAVRARMEQEVREALRVLAHPDLGIQLRREMVALQRERIAVLKRTFLSRFQPFDHQMRLFEAGLRYPVRATFGGNRTGKTIGGCAETAYHATGLYPDWWPGVRFTAPPKIWVSSTKLEKVVNGVQKMIFGTVQQPGTGFLPADRILEFEKSSEEKGLVRRAFIKWGRSGEGVAQLDFKAYSQGRKAYESEKVQVQHLDEEPDQEVYDESLMRTLGSDEEHCIMYLTFTPLAGMSSVVKSFLRRRENREELKRRMPELANVDSMMWHQFVSWDDNPTLSAVQRARLIMSMDPRTRRAREKGMPVMGSGLVFPFDREQLVVKPQPIPSYWPVGLTLDHGFNHPCAIGKMAVDPETKRTYLAALHRESNMLRANVCEHLEAMAPKGTPIISGWDGEIASQAADGESLNDYYRDRGFNIIPADKLNDTAYDDLSNAMAYGLFKVFGTEDGGPAESFIEEIEFFHRDDKGKLVAVGDDAITSALIGYRHRSNFMSINDVENRYDDDDDEASLEHAGTWRSAG